MKKNFKERNKCFIFRKIPEQNLGSVASYHLFIQFNQKIRAQVAKIYASIIYIAKILWPEAS